MGSNRTLHDVVRGLFHGPNRRQRTLAPSWSLDEVLRALAEPPYEPMHSSTLELLTHKTLFLVAAASARRRSGIHALSLKEGLIRFEQDGVRLLPDPAFLAKNQTASFTPEEIFLPAIGSISTIREDKRWCPVRALRWYIDRTKLVRRSDRLFLLPRSPYSPASKATLSRWIRDLIGKHTEADQPRAHDVRGLASSRAWSAHVPLEDILRAAGWKTPSTFIACYLTPTLPPDGSFARAALNPPRR